MTSLCSTRKTSSMKTNSINARLGHVKAGAGRKPQDIDSDEYQHHLQQSAGPANAAQV